MRHRPWPIIFFALIQFLMPLFSVIFNAIIFKVSFLFALNALWTHSGVMAKVEFFFLYPIAGLCIFLMKKWSYPIFVVINLWTITSNIMIWLSNSNQAFVSTGVIIFVTLLNISFVTYYMLPAVRQVYFNKNIRWWESQPRYQVHLKTRLKQADQNSISCTLRDFSDGGTFFETQAPLKKGETVNLEISFFGITHEFKGQIVHTVSGPTPGFGCHFFPSRENTKVAKSITHLLKDIGCPLTYRSQPLWKNFLSWSKMALKGKGFLPKTE